MKTTILFTAINFRNSSWNGVRFLSRTADTLINSVHTRGYVRHTARNMAAPVGSVTVNKTAKGPQWLSEKEKYLKMDLEQKRGEYRCKDAYVTLDKIQTWKEFVEAKGDKESLPSKDVPPEPLMIKNELNLKLAGMVSFYRGDITTLEVDAIVNAANKSLLGGGGVDGAIHRAAGPFLVEENKTLGGCEVGEAKISGGYKLPAKYVISTVGPQGEKPDLLRKCYSNCLQVMRQHELKTIAFPCISTGIYGYPIKPAAHVAAKEVRRYLEKYHNKVERVVFCLFSEVDEDCYKRILQSYFPVK